MNRFRRTDTYVSPVVPSKRLEPLSDNRYQELLERAKSFFVSAEVPAEDERLAAISEINELMARHGLTIDDLV